jgi:hypothetical protein
MKKQVDHALSLSQFTKGGRYRGNIKRCDYPIIVFSVGTCIIEVHLEVVLYRRWPKD